MSGVQVGLTEPYQRSGALASSDQSPSSASDQSPGAGPNSGVDGEGATESPGFLGLIVQSIWEPGANYAVVMAMNVSFFLLILVLVGLAAITSWNAHVLLLLFVTTLLWGAMMWFIVELTRMQGRTDNLPPGDPGIFGPAPAHGSQQVPTTSAAEAESKKAQ